MMLNDKHQKFIAEYIIDLNATQAAKRAGYSDKTAYSQGQRLLKHAEIQAALTKELKSREKRTEVTQDRVLLEIARLAFQDPRKAFTESGSLKPIKEWPDEVAAAISSIEVNAIKGEDGLLVGEVQKVRFWDKPKNLELAGRHLQMFTDKLNVSGQISIPQLLDELKNRADEAAEKCRRK